MVEYRYRHRKDVDVDKRIIYSIIGVVGISLFILFAMNNIPITKTPSDILSYPKELVMQDSYVPVQLLSLNDGMLLGTECQRLFIPITNDQIFSISNGITQDFVRPLTHDIYKITLNHFDIKPTRFTIDKFENELWYATMRFEKGKDILDLDIRPSDGVAMAVRYNMTIYIDKQTLDEKADNVC